MPLNAARLALLVRDQPGDLEQITRRVRFDPVLTARLLGVANAASPASGQELTCVEQATQHLGNAGTLAILGMHLPMRSSLGAGAPSSSSETKLWKHSMLCAIATEQLNHFGRTEVLPESFATALLHDLGAMLLARRPGLEANSTGTHAQLGARVARHWGLPERISAGIEHHHAPLGAPDEHTRRLCSQVLPSAPERGASRGGWRVLRAGGAHPLHTRLGGLPGHEPGKLLEPLRRYQSPLPAPVA